MIIATNQSSILLLNSIFIGAQNLYHHVILSFSFEAKMMELCIHPTQTSNQRTILRIIEIINFDVLIKLKGYLYTIHIQVIL